MDNKEKLATLGTPDEGKQKIKITTQYVLDELTNQYHCGQVTGVHKAAHSFYSKINVREYRRNNQEWTIQRNWQHWAHKTKAHKTKHIAQYLSDTTICKQPQVM